ncbi:guanylate cyclase activator 2B [Suncus etruscus]|uniref:guanylate cyclase activator 2B n=1 Tax=Suncus etruscus TaxID=109475 RepID=UPI002110CB7B|nr:guanylate cyclase activator 2B [Suncus etruscus]
MGTHTIRKLLTSAVMVFLLLLLQRTQSVTIQYQGFEVQLDSMKKLHDLEEKGLLRDLLQSQSLQSPVCSHPDLPRDLQPVCASQDATSILQALRKISNDNCELCENVACTGCM